tara:strand:+ start:1769 stop:2086 length:318 start_codon:yes stop_codon:yes gene_type:complete
MPYTRNGKCVYKKNKDGSRGEKVGCSDSEAMAKRYLKALYASEKDVTSEVKDYFNSKDDDYLEFDDHPLSSIESLMDPDKPAPWDHLTNFKGDKDYDVDVQERNK